MNGTTRVILLLTASLLVGGCARTDGQIAAPAASRAPVPSDRAVMERRDLILTLDTERTTYQPGEHIAVVASVENRRSEPVAYHVCCIGYPVPIVSVDTGPYGRVELWEDEEPPAFPAAEEIRLLKPGERVSRRVFWDQKVMPGGERTQTPGGTYRIKASLNLVDERIEVELPINIEGGGRLVSHDEAVQQALSLPEVAAWYRARTGEAFKQDPVVGAVMSGGNWQVRLGQKLAPPPHEVLVVVNARSGEVMNMRFCEKYC